MDNRVCVCGSAARGSSGEPRAVRGDAVRGAVGPAAGGGRGAAPSPTGRDSSRPRPGTPPAWRAASLCALVVLYGAVVSTRTRLSQGHVRTFYRIEFFTFFCRRAPVPVGLKFGARSSWSSRASCCAVGGRVLKLYAFSAETETLHPPASTIRSTDGARPEHDRFLSTRAPSRVVR